MDGWLIKTYSNHISFVHNTLLGDPQQPTDLSEHKYDKRLLLEYGYCIPISAQIWVAMKLHASFIKDMRT